MVAYNKLQNDGITEIQNYVMGMPAADTADRLRIPGFSLLVDLYNFTNIFSQ
jgi:hypothetical protein